MTSKSQQATATKIRLKRVANTDGSSSYKFFSPLDGLRFCNVVRRPTEGWTIQWVRTPSETSWARTLPKARRIIGAALVYRDHPGHGPNGAPQGALPTILAKSVTVANFTSRGTYNCASCGKLTRDTGEGEYDAKMCRACFDRETWALGHDDHSEDNRPNDCPFCE